MEMNYILGGFAEPFAKMRFCGHCTCWVVPQTPKPQLENPLNPKPYLETWSPGVGHVSPTRTREWMEMNYILGGFAEPFAKMRFCGHCTCWVVPQTPKPQPENPLNPKPQTIHP